MTQLFLSDPSDGYTVEKLCKMGLCAVDSGLFTAQQAASLVQGREQSLSLTSKYKGACYLIPNSKFEIDIGIVQS